MAVEYSIPQLLQLAGIAIPSPGLGVAIDQMLNAQTQKEYERAQKAVTQNITGYGNVDVYDYAALDKNNVGSIFGLPIFMPFLFEHIEDDTQDGDFLIDSAIVSVNRSRNIVITEVQGRDTSIKEFINNGDLNINVKGTLASNEVGYPKGLVKRLDTYFTAKQSLSVVNELLSIFKVNEIVITDYDFEETPFNNIQKFSFSAISEKPAELIIDEKES